MLSMMVIQMILKHFQTEIMSYVALTVESQTEKYVTKVRFCSYTKHKCIVEKYFVEFQY